MSDLAIDLYNRALDIEAAMAELNLAAFPTMRKWDDQDQRDFQAAIRKLQAIAFDLKQACRPVEVA